MISDFSDDQPLRPAPSLRDHFSAFSLIFSALFLSHAALLRLPYFWDEAGYYVPAARDFLLTGALIPFSALSNAHPPMLAIYLSAWWKFSGYTPAVTRIAMLLVASFTLLATWRIGSMVANRAVAVLAVLCTAIYPVFFAQSTMAHLDMLAAAFTLWGLVCYIEQRPVRMLILFSLAGLAKETAMFTPAALILWELFCPFLKGKEFCLHDRNWRYPLLLAFSGIPIAAWLTYHHHHTGYFLGNPGYLYYNLGATLSPLRFLFAAGLRLWHCLGYLNLFVLTLLALAAMLEKPRVDDGVPRRRIAISIQLIFALLIFTHIVALAILGGAVLARYLLPVYPLIVLLFVSTLHRRLRWWPVAIAAVTASFVAGLIFNPPYRFAPEDNLAYRDFVLLHKEAASYLSQNTKGVRVLTAWPAADEITRPWLGYVKDAIPTVHIDNFTGAQIELAAAAQGQYGWVYLFSTKYEPPRLLFHSRFWEQLQTRFFDNHVDLPPETAARMLGGKIVYRAQRHGEWIALVRIEQVENAELRRAP